jgi:ABC-type glutathione transport system ATPase component
LELNTGLACCRLDFRWPGKQADAPFVLESVEAGFSPGTVSLVTGATGSGKSTLLHLLAGLLRPSAGEVWADGQPVSRWPSRHRDPWRQQTGIVFQHLALVPDLTVAENLLLPLIPRRNNWSRMQADVHRQLTEADLSDLATVPANALCPAGSASVWPSPGHWWSIPGSSWPMSPPLFRTTTTRKKSAPSWASPPVKGRWSLSAPTIRGCDHPIT